MPIHRLAQGFGPIKATGRGPGLDENDRRSDPRCRPIFVRPHRVTSPKQSIFIRSALASGLVTQEQIAAAEESVRSAGGLSALPAVGVGDDKMAEALIEMGALTPYQCEQLRAGRKKLNLGPYMITDWLGQGGMGQVFVAVHQMMDRQVAIKVLPLSKSTPESIASFTREIQTQAKLDHKNLVRAYDAGHDGSVYFLVTEYVPGTDLRRLVRSQGRLTMAQSASVIKQAALGLGYAHQQGLVHRDVKPGNLLVTPDGLVKVSDLGLAGFLHEGPNDPRAGKIVGTPDYLAPEKIKNPHLVQPASDIYALGCTLYYAVTGKVPFPGGTTRDKARRHCDETPWHPRKFNADVTDEFVDLIADMMEKDVRKRIRTAEQVVERLSPWSDQLAMLPRPMAAHSHAKAPPLPVTGRDDTVDDVEATFSNSSQDLGDQVTPDADLYDQTDSASGAMATITPPPAPATDPPPPTADEQRRREVRQAVILAVCWTVPIAMLGGGLLTYLFMTYM